MTSRRSRPLVANCLLLLSFFVILNGATLSTQAQVAGWPYSIHYWITNPNGTDLKDYQVRFIIDHASLVTNGVSRSDAADFRFCDSTGTLYPYWIESGIATSQCVVWVKVKKLAALANTNIWFAYGMISATPVSNGDSTFLFFDDFSGSTLDTTKWSLIYELVNAGGTATVANSELTFVSGQTSIPPRATVLLETKLPIDATGPKKTRVRLKAPNWGGLGALGVFRNCSWEVRDQNSVDGGYVAFDENGEHVFGTSTNQSGVFSPLNYMIVECNVFHDTTKMAINDLLLTSWRYIDGIVLSGQLVGVLSERRNR